MRLLMKVAQMERERDVAEEKTGKLEAKLETAQHDLQLASGMINEKDEQLQRMRVAMFERESIAEANEFKKKIFRAEAQTMRNERNQAVLALEAAEIQKKLFETVSEHTMNRADDGLALDLVDGGGSESGGESETNGQAGEKRASDEVECPPEKKQKTEISWIVFRSDELARVKVENPDIKFHERLKIVSARWAAYKADRSV
ncbi:hypothetical protein HK104_005332 [Borealophlyctis nickersoniae]|nr:hypothetical protein HK104_005332 [Borealophlyctis nickersoniae]